MARKKKDKTEGEPLGEGEVQFDTADAEAIGDPAAASVEAEGAAPGTAEVEAPGATETAAEALHEPLVGDPAGEGGYAGGNTAPDDFESGGYAGGNTAPDDFGAPAEQTPAAADARGAEHAESPPFIPIAAAFVGAFVAAKLLGKLGGGDD